MFCPCHAQAGLGGMCNSGAPPGGNGPDPAACSRASLVGSYAIDEHRAPGDRYGQPAVQQDHSCPGLAGDRAERWSRSGHLRSADRIRHNLGEVAQHLRSEPVL